MLSTHLHGMSSSSSSSCKRVPTGYLIEPHRPSRVLRSTNSHLLAVPSCPKCSFASRAFCVSSPNNWNSLPLHIRSSDSLATFKSRLKSHLFASAYHVKSLTRQRLWFDHRLLALYKYFIDIDGRCSSCCLGYYCHQIFHFPNDVSFSTDRNETYHIYEY